MIVSSAGLETKIDCAGEDLQQFTQPCALTKQQTLKTYGELSYSSMHI
jgi:hypothetical protein